VRGGRGGGCDELTNAPLALSPPLIHQIGLSFILAFVCMSLYYCLSEWTGAVPAEYFSVQKRAGYDTYMKTTNMIVPWFVREAEEEEEEEKEEEEKEEKKVSTPSRRGRSRGATKRNVIPAKKEKKTPAKKTPAKKNPTKRATATPRRSSRKPARKINYM